MGVTCLLFLASVRILWHIRCVCQVGCCQVSDGHPRLVLLMGMQGVQQGHVMLPYTDSNDKPGYRMMYDNIHINTTSALYHP